MAASAKGRLMEIGQIFLRLGVKADGQENVGKFETGVKAATTAAHAMADGVQRVGFILEKIANKMGALAEGDLSTFNAALHKTGENEKGVTENTDKLHVAAGKAHGSVKSLKDRFSEIITPVNLARLEIIGAITAITGLVKKASDVAFELTKFHNVTGLSTQTLQEWQQQAALSGVAGGELAGTIESLQRAGAEASLRGLSGPWVLLGIDPKQDPFVVLNQLKTRLTEFPAAMGTMLARDVGLTDSMISFLKEAKNLPATDKSLILSPGEIDRLKHYNILFNKTWDAAKRTLQHFGEILLPVATRIIWGLDRMNHAFEIAIHGTGYFADHLKKMGPVLTAVGLVVAAAFFPITTAVVGLMLLFEDMMTWSKGGKSLTGAIIGPFENWKGTLVTVDNALKSIKDTLTWLSNASLEKLANWFTPVTGSTGPGGAKSGNPDHIGTGSAILSAIGDFFNRMMYQSPEERKKAFEEIKKDDTHAAALFGPTLSATPAPTTINNVININGAQDPRRTGEETAKAIRTTFDTAPQTAGGR
jgi:hypothetical protein